MLPGNLTQCSILRRKVERVDLAAVRVDEEHCPAVRRPRHAVGYVEPALVRLHGQVDRIEAVQGSFVLVKTAFNLRTRGTWKKKEKRNQTQMKTRTTSTAAEWSDISCILRSYILKLVHFSKVRFKVEFYAEVDAGRFPSE